MFVTTRHDLIRPKASLWDLGSAIQSLVHRLGLRGQSQGGTLELIGSLSLSAHASVAAVRFGGRTFMLGVTSQNVGLLAQECAPESDAVGASEGRENG